jgi:hemerythrin
VTRLRREHQKVARILVDVRSLLETEVGQSELRDRLAELSQELDAHMEFEEAEIVAALNNIGSTSHR